MESILNESTHKLNSSRVTHLLDLSDEILLLICRYLSPVYVLHSFYTPERPKLRLHRVISDYYSKIKLDGIMNYEYNYLLDLFRDCKRYLQIESLILSNEHITCLTQRYFSPIPKNEIRLMFTNLKYLTLINCSTDDISTINLFEIIPLKLEYFHLTLIKPTETDEKNVVEEYNISIKKLLFDQPIFRLHTLSIEVDQGLTLNRSLTIQENLRNVNLCLQTIDDLYVLLDGLIPNVTHMIIHLCQKRILNCHRPKSRPACLLLIEFMLIEPGLGLVTDNMKCIFGFMPNILQLTLSLRNTSDPLFCNGPFFESILNDSFAHLKKFYYTMTHRIVNEDSIKNFVQWPMNVIFHTNQDFKWVHIFSLSQFNKRQLPILKNEFDQIIISDLNIEEYLDHIFIQNYDELLQLKTRYRYVSKLTSSILIDIPLSKRISKIIFTKEIPIFSRRLCVQPSVYHLRVERRLTNENEILDLAYQFPNVQYLKLFLPIENTLYIRCMKSIFHRDHTNEYIYIWPYLINFATDFNYKQLSITLNNDQFYEWLIQHTDLKYDEHPFYVDVHCQTISVWF